MKPMESALVPAANRAVKPASAVKRKAAAPNRETLLTSAAREAIAAELRAQLSKPAPIAFGLQDDAVDLSRMDHNANGEA